MNRVKPLKKKLVRDIVKKILKLKPTRLKKNCGSFQGVTVQSKEARPHRQDRPQLNMSITGKDKREEMKQSCYSKMIKENSLKEEILMWRLRLRGSINLRRSSGLLVSVVAQGMEVTNQSLNFIKIGNFRYFFLNAKKDTILCRSSDRTPEIRNVF